MIHALMPDIHRRQTGGSIYNRRVLECLARSNYVRVHLGPSANHGELLGGLWLVDSNCIEEGAAHLAKRPDASGVLIAHYLELLDPDRRHSARAGEEASFVSRYRGVVTSSRFAQNALREAGFQGLVEAISPGLDGEYRQTVPRSTDSDSSAIVTVASVLPDKGLTGLLEVLETLSELRWSWEVIGDADLNSDFAHEFCERLARSPIADRVKFRGPLSPQRVIDAYDRADMFALPSRFETCSMATMEAMARGLPVAAFRVGGLPDLLPEFSRRILAEPGDLAGLRELLRLLIINPVERRGLGEENRRAAESFHSWDDCGRAMQRFIAQILS